VNRARALVSLAAVAVVTAACLLPSAESASSTQRVGEVAIFYYPWYSTPGRDGGWAHWYVERDGRQVLSTPYFPKRGLYSSSSPKIVEAQMREIRAAGVDTVVVSWWGFGSPEANRLPLVAEAARRHGLHVAVHLEPYGGRTPERTAHDISRLRSEGYHDFYVYDAERNPAPEWAQALAGHGDARVFGHTALAGRAKASGFDGLYTYDIVTWQGSSFRRICGQARRLGLLCAPSIGPGFDATLATPLQVVRHRRHGKTYDRMWRSAIAARADVVTITSYNEWQEGTQIEPARLAVGRQAYEGAWGRRGASAQRAYLDATAHWAARYRALARQ
jgi:glycoprotein endo-alpha-1,2-mannosidase